MGMAPREDVRRALIQRVARKVSGHGITRRSIESAVDRVLASLPADLGAARPATQQVAVLAAPSAPDLASRARRVLERQGATVVGMGTGSAGRHTVVTVRLDGSGGRTLEQAAAELGASLTLLDPADATRFDG
jgi:hypothetical protein